MSASLLLGYISAALAIQAVVAIAVALWRRRRRLSLPVASQSDPPNPRAWDGWRELRVVHRKYEDRAHTVCTFHLEPVDGTALPSFVPGQFLAFAVPTSAGRVLTRCYSLSDGPNGRDYRISVKRVLAPIGRPELPPGLCSNQLHDGIELGDVLKAKAPTGHFVVGREPNVPVVLLAGGIGITPLLSMLRGGLAAEPNRMVHLYYGVRHGAEHSFRSELEELARMHPTFDLNVVYSQPGPDDVSGRDFQYIGHIDVDLLRRTLPAGRHRFYVCGPPAMMASLLPALGQWGVLATDIHHEVFGPGSAQSALPSPRANVRSPSPLLEVMFRKSARTLTWDGTDANLLEFAERHDLPIEAGCRSGSCGTCEVKLLSGTVRYSEHPDHDITPGYCRLCIAFPDSPLELEA